MGGRTWTSLGVVVVLVVGAWVAAAGAAGTPTGPTLSALVIAASDVSGAKVDGQQAGKVSGYDNYERIIHFSKPYGASRYVAYLNVAILTTSADSAKAVYPGAVKSYSSPVGRATLVKVFALKGTGVTFGKARTTKIALGDEGVEVSFIARHKGDSANVSMVLFRVDRVIEIGAAEGEGDVAKVADALALGKLIEKHARAALTPAAVAAPTITGTPTQGQTLTATPGTWTNAPTTYGYQWQHCDAAGATCADIAGSTAATYAVLPADVGTTLRVNVTATNGVAAVVAPSAVTVAVT